MTPRVRAGLILAVTLGAGILIGFLAAGAVSQRRADRVADLRGRGGFVEFMLEVIQPRDRTQREAILPYLEETARRNRETLVGTRREIRARMDSLRAELAPLLDEEQASRLERAIRLRDVFRGPRRDRFREGPPGERPPRGRRHPPP